jgi:hypothetical protein
LYLFPDIGFHRPVGGKNTIIGRQLIVSNDLEVIAFIEAVINGTAFAQERNHRPLGLVQHKSVIGVQLSALYAPISPPVSNRHFHWILY